MEFKLKNKYLIDLYTTGKCKKYNFLNKKVVENFLFCIQTIEAAIVIQDWWELKSLKFEKLEGFEKRFSMRIDDKHRLEFEIAFEDKEKTKGFVIVLKISKHYK